MPRLNLFIIFSAVLIYALTAGTTLRDRLLINTLHRIEKDALFKPTEKELFENAMAGMPNALVEEHGDIYSMYIPPRRQSGYLDIVNNDFRGFGISHRGINEEEKLRLIVDYPFIGSPAHQAGLRSGDRILKIDGTDIAGQSFYDVTKLLQNQTLPTRFSILPFGQSEAKEYVIAKERFHVLSVEGAYIDAALSAEPHNYCLEHHPDIGYIRLTTFSGTTAEELAGALDKINQSGAESFILDLRDNPGGDVWNCVQVAQMLIAKNKKNNIIAAIRDRKGSQRQFMLNREIPQCTLPMAVLIDGGSASSAEIVAAALQDHGRATVVGTRSYGKGVVQGIYTLPFQTGMLQLTEEEYRRPNGKNIHRKKNAAETEDWGIIPDCIVEISESERQAVLEYRRLCSNVFSEQRATVLKQFRGEIEQQIREEFDESQFSFPGSAPYYDPQLEAAIERL